MKTPPHVSPYPQPTLAKLLRAGNGAPSRDFRDAPPAPCHALGSGPPCAGIRRKPRRRP